MEEDEAREYGIKKEKKRGGGKLSKRIEDDEEDEEEEEDEDEEEDEEGDGVRIFILFYAGANTVNVGEFVKQILICDCFVASHDSYFILQLGIFGADLGDEEEGARCSAFSFLSFQFCFQLFFE